MMDKVIKIMINNKLSDLHTCLPCKVVSTSPLSVKPTPTRDLLGEDTEYPVIADVKMIGGWESVNCQGIWSEIRLELVPGDLVVVVFSERAIDGVGNRKHDLADGIVLGKLV